MPFAIACLITRPDEQEIFVNLRAGMLRVLDLLGDDMDVRLSDTVEELETQASILLENSGDATIRWAFVPVMDMTVVPG